MCLIDWTLFFKTHRCIAANANQSENHMIRPKLLPLEVRTTRIIPTVGHLAIKINWGERILARNVTISPFWLSSRGPERWWEEKVSEDQQSRQLHQSLQQNVQQINGTNKQTANTENKQTISDRWQELSWLLSFPPRCLGPPANETAKESASWPSKGWCIQQRGGITTTLPIDTKPDTNVAS